YYRGGGSKTSVELIRNDFIYNSLTKIKQLNRLGQEKPILLDHLFYGRDIDQFLFIKNRILTEHNNHFFSDFYNIKISNVKNSVIENNEIFGGIYFTGGTASALTFMNNKIKNTA